MGSSKMLASSMSGNSHSTDMKNSNLKKVNLEVDYNAPKLKNDVCFIHLSSESIS